MLIDGNHIGLKAPSLLIHIRVHNAWMADGDAEKMYLSNGLRRAILAHMV